MLTRLYVRQLGLLEIVDITPQAGLTVVTGETGAGKSMLMDALSLTLGERADTTLIRQGSDAAQVEATFTLPNHSPLPPLLDDADILLEEKELTLRRTLQNSSGKSSSKALANGVRITAQHMKNFGEHLADIHGQHEHQLLLNPKRHADILDHFGKLQKERDQVKTTYRTYKNALTTLKEAEARQNQQDSETLHLKSWLEELNALHYETGEEDTLAQNRARLMHAEHITHALTQAENAFQSTEISGALDLLRTVETQVSSAAEKGGNALQTLSERCTSLLAEAEDISAEITQEAQSSDLNPEALQEADNRLAALRDSARKHDIQISDIPTQIEHFSNQLSELENLSDNIETLKAEAKRTRILFDTACKTLTSGRTKTAQTLKTAIEKALQTLHMPHCQFEVDLTPEPSKNWNARGAEKVAFCVSTNPGQPVKPLVHVASGGEVSRLMLALKAVFYKNMPPMTLVFDEIDTGLGGAVADAVGDTLKSLSQIHQIFAITHQPQVAAKGNSHLHIQKHVTDKTTHTTLTFLDDLARQKELARMLSGKDITPEATATAKKMLKTA